LGRGAGKRRAIGQGGARSRHAYLVMRMSKGLAAEMSGRLLACRAVDKVQSKGKTADMRERERTEDMSGDACDRRVDCPVAALIDPARL
jgi:hypothetical protein